MDQSRLASAVYSRPCDSATALYVIAPLYTFTPSARPEFSRIAFCEAEVGQPPRVRQRGVREGDRRGARHGARHVGDAVVDDAVDDVDVGLECVVACAVSTQPPWSMATSTITEPFFMSRDHVARHELRRRGARDQHAADEEVGARAGVGDVRAVRGERLDAAVEDVVELAQAVEVRVEDRHARAEADGHLRGVGADDAAADDHDVGRAARPARRRAGCRGRRSASAGSTRRRAPTCGRRPRDIGVSSGRVRSRVGDRLVGDAGDLLVERGPASARARARGAGR